MTKKFYLLLAILTIPLCITLWSGGLIKGHDAFAGFVRVICMGQGFGEGQIYPRWLSDLNFGYGSPMFNFYPPLFYFLTVLPSKLFHQYLFSLNLICTLFWFLSGYGMYLFSKELWGRKGGLLSAFVYLYIPYHIQDLYVRGAFAEFSAMAIFPFILLAFLKLYQNPSRGWFVLGVFGVATLTLTHNVMSMLFMPIVLLYIIFLTSLTGKYKTTLISLLIVLTGLMISAFFWMPALLEKEFLNLSFLVSMRYDFHQNFVSMSQLLRVPWSLGTDADGITFQIGLVQLLLGLSTLFFIIQFFKRNRIEALNYLFFLILAVIGVFLMLPCSNMLWGHISLLRFVQLPWRLLAIVAFSVSIMAGSVLLLIKRNGISNLLLAIAVVLMILCSHHFFWPGHYQDINVQATDKNLVSHIFLGEGEYTPKWIEIPPLMPPAQRFEFVKGQGQWAEYQKKNSIDYQVLVKANQPSIICFHSFYFPGWKAYVDGTQVDINANNRYGLILFDVPSGEHRLRVVFESTPLRHMAGLISWLGWGLVLLGMIYYRRWEWILK